MTANASEPMRIAEQGYFFVGGHYEHSRDAEGRPTRAMTGQMYVEYQIPAEPVDCPPIVMIHGGFQTGINFTGTPDGREGWAQYFLRRGYTVYVVDGVARGRSAGNYATYGEMNHPGSEYASNRFIAPALARHWPQAHLHTQFPGADASGGTRPGDPAYDEFFASQVSSIADYPRQQILNAAAGAALLDRIGPAILLTHSQSGAFGWLIADRRPKLVKAILAMEPNGPPVHDLMPGPNWSVENEIVKAGGLCHAALTYEPPLGPGEELAFVCEASPQGPDLARCWRQAEPARRLVNLAGIPVLILTGEASYHAPYDHCTSQYLTQAGVPNTFIKLADRGIRGNGHMLMIERNNHEIAAVIAEWLGANAGAIGGR